MEDQPDPDAERTGEVHYELDDWSAEARDLLDRLLTSNEVAHAWQGGTVTVSEADEDAVDDLDDEVELALQPSLDPDAERVVYEVAEWGDELRQAFGDALTAEGIRHEWDQMGDVAVEAADEDRVDALLDAMEGLDDEEDGPEPSEVLSELFVASDKLRRNPRDVKAVSAAMAGATSVVALAPPYGLDRRTWARIGLKAGSLRLALTAEPADDEAVGEAAEELRELLHPLV